MYGVLLAILVLLLAGVWGPALAAQNEDRQAVELVKLARSGAYQDLLTRIHGQTSAPPPQAVLALQQDLEAHLTRHLEHTVARDQARQAAHDETVQEARDEKNDGKHEDALVSIIKAHALAKDPDAFLNDPLTQTVVGKAHLLAGEAEEKHDWVEAVSLYRLLNLLYEDTHEYRDDLERVAAHVRVLQTYHPDHLRELYAARDKRLGRDEQDAEDGDGRDPMQDDDVELDQWDVRLKGVEFDMLKHAMRRAKDKHVDRGTYEKLVQGAMTGLAIFVETEGLDEVFPALAEPDRLARFQQFLGRQQDRLEAREQALHGFQAEDLLREVLDFNDAALGLPQEVLIHEMAFGMTETLDDFSAMVWPSDLEKFNRDLDGKFFGIGVQIRRQDGKLTVVTPIVGTPAQKAGIRANDVIAQVDGARTGTWTLDKAVRRITGEQGTVVTLGIERVGEKELLQLPIVRDEIKIESIKGWSLKPDGSWSYWLDREAGIGYIRMSKFIPQSAEVMDRAVNALQQEGELNGLVLDLRFNPGGLLTSAIDIADRFIEQGRLVSTIDGDMVRSSPVRARKRGTYNADLDLVILINQGSASASEIVAGALQDYDRALIIGTRSFGKGSVQNLYPIATRTKENAEGKPVRNALGLPVREVAAYLKLTTEYYQIPKGRVIHRRPHHTEADEVWGITPDLILPMTDEQVADALELRQDADILLDPEEAEQAVSADSILEQGLDPQLDAAILYLKTVALSELLADAVRDTRSAQRPE